MKVHLMAPDRDFHLADAGHEPTDRLNDLVQDLQLDVLFDAMAAGDPVIRNVAEAALLAPPLTIEQARYRLRVLADFAEHPQLARRLYDIAGRALERPRGAWYLSTGRPESLLRQSQLLLGHLLDAVDELRLLVATEFAVFDSPGLRGFAEVVRTELPDDFMAQLRELLATLERRDGVLMVAGLGRAGAVHDPQPHIVQRVGKVFAHLGLAGETLSFTIPDRDESGSRALQALRDRALWNAAEATEQASSHVRGFFEILQHEAAFFLGCLNLRDSLSALGASMSLPELVADPDVFIASGLYDPCLVLRTGSAAVTNDIDTGGKRLLVITGANHGGKTTLLRAIGVAQVLADAGAYVPAAALKASSSRGVFTHWQREEDANLRHGKFELELARMNEVIDEVRSGSMLLSNESFSSTNEAEGSEIARGVVRGLVDAGVRVMLVTHLYDLADDLFRSDEPAGVFLRAERGAGGDRSYRISPGAPLPTGFARDFYQREFGSALPEPSLPLGLPDER